MHKPTTEKHAEPLEKLPRTELVRLAQLTLDVLGSLLNTGDFRPLDIDPDGTLQMHGALTPDDITSIYMSTYLHLLKAKEVGEGLTDERLARLIRLGLMTLSTLHIQSKFRPMDPSIAAAAVRYNAGSEANMEELLLLAIAEAAERPFVTKVMLSNPPSS